jgi:hypothetical protein
MVSDYEYYLITPYAIRAALLKPTLCNKCELYDSETEIYVAIQHKKTSRALNSKNTVLGISLHNVYSVHLIFNFYCVVVSSFFGSIPIDILVGVVSI